jgi:hypothetical protein
VILLVVQSGASKGSSKHHDPEAFQTSCSLVTVEPFWRWANMYDVWTRLKERVLIKYSYISCFIFKDKKPVTKTCSVAKKVNAKSSF